MREAEKTGKTLEPITGRTANFGNFRTVKKREDEELKKVVLSQFRIEKEERKQTAVIPNKKLLV